MYLKYSDQNITIRLSLYFKGNFVNLNVSLYIIDSKNLILEITVGGSNRELFSIWDTPKPLARIENFSIRATTKKLGCFI